MNQGHKFGTFGGVFTPSLLTILGVIMYLRLPWIVGNGGLLMVVGIILVAHVISVTTGLSVASIATDKRVRTGGPYYIVSRSLGLPIGGTLGIALFIGLSFSVSLYVIGFSESFLSVINVEPTKDNIRICGSVTLVAVTIVTLISTAFAIKLQYIIMALIGLSLVSILAGDPAYVPSQPAIEPELDEGVSVAVLFGIFFPAVTGFTAGVNMSGDLKDPKVSLPKGTIWAISVGLITYLGLAAFLAFRVDRDQLSSNPNILLDMSLYAPLVVAGIWGATLSSALGSILGAPRILQATAMDRITPKIFAKGHGRTNEPRNPLILTFGIAEVGILIGELDAIAAIVSMFFIATYGFLNVSCAIESWANPDFRPEFKLPTLVPVTGAVTCVVIMIQLDFLAMIAATALMAGVFVVIKRRQLRLESGDTWEGVWSSLVRSGLQRLNRGVHQRQWRPNILAFSHRNDDDRALLTQFGSALVATGGVMTDFELVDEKTRISLEDGESTVGVFHRVTPSQNPFETMEAICRYHGFSGIEPNTLLLSYDWRRKDPEAFNRLLRCADKLEFNTLLWRSNSTETSEGRERIDIWWRPEAGRLRFALTVARFLTTSPEWRDAKLRFLIVHNDGTKVDGMHKRIRRVFDDMRVSGDVQFIDSQLHDQTFFDLVRQESASTDLSFIGLPELDIRSCEDAFTSIDELQSALPHLVVYRCSKDFPPLFEEARKIRSFLATDEGQVTVDVEPLRLPHTDGLAKEVQSFAQQHEALFRDFHERYLARHVGREITLLNDLEAALTRSFSHLEKTLEGASKRRQRKLVSRAQTSFLFQSRQILSQFESEDLVEQREGMTEAIEFFERTSRDIVGSYPARVTILLPRSTFRKEPGESAALGRFKLRKRIAAMFQGDTVRVEVPLGALVRYHVNQESYVALRAALSGVAGRSTDVAIDVRRLIQSVHHTLAVLEKRVEDGDVSTKAIGEDKARLSGDFIAVAKAHNDETQHQLSSLLASSRRIVQQLAIDVEDVAIVSAMRRFRRVASTTARGRREFPEAPGTFFLSQSLLLKRTDLELQMVALHLRIATIVHRMEAGLSLRLQNSILAPYEEFVISLEQFAEGLKEEEAKELRFFRDQRHSFEARAILDDLIREIHAATGELAESIDIIDDESVATLEADPFAETTPVAVGLRRMVESLVEREFLGGVHEVLNEIEHADQHGQAVVAEVLRLIAFNLGDIEGGEDESMADLMGPVAENGLERCRAQLEELRTIASSLHGQLERLLHTAQERTNSYAILREVHRPSDYSKGSSRLFPTFAEYLRKILTATRRGFTQLRYRRRRAMMAARRLTEKRPVAETVVDRMLVHSHVHGPSPEISEGLPFYYRQLFLGRSAVNEDFWVGRAEELAQGRRAIENNREGFRGALVVTGRSMSGKSAFCRHLTNKMFDKGRTHHVFPPRSGAGDVALFKRNLADTLEVQGELSDIFGAIKEQSAIVLHDVELWWNRRSDGLEVIKLIMRLVEDYGDRTLFVLNMNTAAFRFISKLVPLADHALTVVHCGAMPAEELRDVILLRHRSTGHRFRLDQKREEQLSEWALARVFTGIFDYAQGNVGVALQAWISHIESVQHTTISLKCPSTTNLDLFDELRMEWIALLVQFVLHKRLTRERILHITEVAEPTLSVSINTLIRMGLVTESSSGVLELNRFTAHMIGAYLDEQGLLP